MGPIPVEHNRIHQILSAPISHFTKSTETEKTLFPDKKGWFYTIGLASGQRFVAHMDSDTNAIENVFTLRPLNHVLPDLKEIQWIENPLFGGHGVDVVCYLSDKVSDAEKEVYESELRPKQMRLALGNMSWITQTVYEDHPLFKRLSDVHDLKLTCEASKKSLLASQEQLKSLEISDQKQPVQQFLNLDFVR